MKTEVKLLFIRRQKYGFVDTGFIEENSHDQRKLFRCAKRSLPRRVFGQIHNHLTAHELYPKLNRHTGNTETTLL